MKTPAVGFHQNHKGERRQVTQLHAGDIWFRTDDKPSAQWCTPQEWAEWLTGEKPTRQGE